MDVEKKHWDWQRAPFDAAERQNGPAAKLGCVNDPGGPGWTLRCLRAVRGSRGRIPSGNERLGLRNPRFQNRRSVYDVVGRPPSNWL